MPLTLYHCAETRSMRSLWLLHELGLDFELVTMPFDHKHLRTKEYLAIHPLGRIPTLVDGDLTLFESGAIAEYLCERYDDGRFGRGLGHSERYPFLKWIHFAETVLIPCQNMVQQYVFIPAEARSEAVVYLETRRLGKCLDAMEAILEGREYLLESGFSAADVSVGFSMYFATVFVSLHDYPRLRGYYERITARPAFRKSVPADQKEPMDWLKPMLGPLRDPRTGKPIG